MSEPGHRPAAGKVTVTSRRRSIGRCSAAGRIMEINGGRGPRGRAGRLRTRERSAARPGWQACEPDLADLRTVEIYPTLARGNLERVALLQVISVTGCIFVAEKKSTKYRLQFG